jgi:acyl-CoA thioesterase-1
MGSTYATSFRNIFPGLATKNKTSLIPFLLKNVGGIPQLNQADGIHPNPTGHRIVATTVWQTLKPLL